MRLFWARIIPNETVIMSYSDGANVQISPEDQFDMGLLEQAWQNTEG